MSYSTKIRIFLRVPCQSLFWINYGNSFKVFRNPFFKTVVAFLVPTTHGIPSSRETMDGWDVSPPMSQTIATDLDIIGTIVGLVSSVTRISPFRKDVKSFESLRIRTLPVAFPELAPIPLSNMLILVHFLLLVAKSLKISSIIRIFVETGFQKRLFSKRLEKS